MDESVLRAMARWPDVPAVYGWLELDRRGRWLIRGEALAHPLANAFISRNYAAGEGGCWYFQNGPQRVFVRLHYTPWVLRLAPGGGLVTHTGRAAGQPAAACLDECGAVLLDTDAGVGLLDDRDLAEFAGGLCDGNGGALDDDAITGRLEALSAGRDAALSVRLGGALRPLEPLASREAPRRFGFDPDPRPQEPDQNA